MFELRTLGTLDLRSPAGAEVRSVLVQPKRLALFAYLVAATPRGFQRRDTLIGVLWPDREPSRARAALRNALHFLRRELGSAVLLNRGDDEVRIDFRRVRSDVLDFERALEEQRREDALGLYEGELLDGFQLASAPVFKQWLDTERVRLRKRATGAAWSLAQAAEAEGDAAGAADWARRATSLDPFSESTLRRLLVTLARLEDRAGALHAYHTFTARLREAFDVEPAAETRAVADAIQSETRSFVVQPPSYRFAWADPPARSVADESPAPRPEWLARRPPFPAERHRQRLATQVEALHAARASLAAGVADAEQSIRRIARTLRGRSAPHRDPSITEASGAIEEAAAADLVAHVDALLERLHAAFARGERNRAVVLVIDDGGSAERDWNAVIDTTTHEIVRAPSAAAAEAVLQRRSVSLILLDLELPDQDGRNLLVHLRERAKTVEVPVIVLADRDEGALRAECLALGADAYFQKPCEPAALGAMISALLHDAPVPPSARGPVPPDRTVDRTALLRLCSEPAAVPMAVAMIGPDRSQPAQPGADGDTASAVFREAVDAVASALGPEALLARWDDATLAAALPNGDAAEMAAHLEEAFLRLEDTRVAPSGVPVLCRKIRAGVAEARDGQSAEEAVAEAAHQLYVARTSGARVARVAPAMPPAPRVLLAEDDDFVASVVETCLRREGIELLHREDGERALSAALGTPLSLVLLDVTLPGMGGFEVLERMRRVPELDPVPIMLLTTKREEAHIEKGLRLGADDFIVKPFSPAQLATRVRRSLAALSGRSIEHRR